jgi:hypothetical protein
VDEVRDLDGGLSGKRAIADERFFDGRPGGFLDRRRDPFGRRPTGSYVE